MHFAQTNKKWQVTDGVEVCVGFFYILNHKEAGRWTYDFIGWKQSEPNSRPFFEKIVSFKTKVHLSGSVHRAWDSSSQGCEFETHIGCGANLKFKNK